MHVSVAADACYVQERQYGPIGMTRGIYHELHRRYTVAAVMCIIVTVQISIVL